MAHCCVGGAEGSAGLSTDHAAVPRRAVPFHRYNKLQSDPTFANGEVFITDDLEVDLQHACALVGVKAGHDACAAASHDGVAALEVGRIVAVWLRRVPPGMRGLLAADYLEQAVYRVLGARHVAAFFATCLAERM